LILIVDAVTILILKFICRVPPLIISVINGGVRLAGKIFLKGNEYEIAFWANQ
jgi:hypothetical protein